MRQEEFLGALRQALSPLPPQERERYVGDYREMIQDCIEDGAAEEEAVAALGTPEELARQILNEVPLGTLVRGRVEPKRKLRGWELALLIAGFPLWFPLLIAAAAVLFSLFVSACAVLLTLTVTGGALVLAGPAALVTGVVQLAHGMTGSGIGLLGCGFLFVGVGLPLCLAGVKLFQLLFRGLAKLLRGWFTKNKKER